MTATDTSAANGPGSSSPATARPRIRVDMAAMSLDELAEIDEAVFERFGCALSDALQDHRQKRAMAVMAWVVHRREDPSFTLEDAGKLRLPDIELVQLDPEAFGASTIDAPPASRVSGA